MGLTIWTAALALALAIAVAGEAFQPTPGTGVAGGVVALVQS